MLSLYHGCSEKIKRWRYRPPFPSLLHLPSLPPPFPFLFPSPLISALHLSPRLPSPLIQLGSLGIALSSPAGPGGARPPNAFMQYRTCKSAHVGRHFSGLGGHSGCVYWNFTNNPFVGSVINCDDFCCF